jgi:hypothetical protein
MKLKLKTSNWLFAVIMIVIITIAFATSTASGQTNGSSQITVNSSETTSNLNYFELHQKYSFYVSRCSSINVEPLSFNDWLINSGFNINRTDENLKALEKTLYRPTCGSYLIKAKKQMIAGYVFEFIGVGAVIVSPTSGGIMAGGACGVIGLIFELSGIGNIGKAGMSFDQNGVGVKVKF